MRKKGLKIILGGFLFLGALFSCEKETLVPYTIDPGDEPLSFATDIQPIFDNNCVSCHGGAISPDLREGTAYSSLIDGGFINTDAPEESELVQKLNDGAHNARAGVVDKQKILLWITQGAENN